MLARVELGVAFGRRTADAGRGAVRTTVAAVVLVLGAAAAMDAQREALLVEPIANACREGARGNIKKRNKLHFINFFLFI